MKTTIFLANRLKKGDSSTGKDSWVLNQIDECQIKVVDKTSISNRAENRKFSYIVLIPFTGKYMLYPAWKSATSSGYTLSVGDYVFLDNPGPITADNIVSKVNAAEDRAFKVQSFTTVKKRFGVRYEIKVTG